MYIEPKVSFLVLDFRKPNESRLLLESLKRHVKFDYKVIYLHNGNENFTYHQDFLNEGLIDQLIITKKNEGLGVGTRNLFAACFSEYAIYVQNDQILGRDFVEEELEYLIGVLDDKLMDFSLPNSPTIKSISLASAPCGLGIYSERAHLIKTISYKTWESTLPNGGAGPYHDSPWREGVIQEFYKRNNWSHWTYPNPLFIDNGQEAVRENPDGSVWKHKPDTKRLWLVRGPVKERFVYPKFSDSEWESVLSTQSWPDGKIPENEVKDSFVVWDK
jgi:hypothetical protein